jgi:hypothetical protein
LQPCSDTDGAQASGDAVRDAEAAADQVTSRPSVR